MASAPFMAAQAGIQAASGIFGSVQANAAAQAQASYERDVLRRKRSDAKNALKENKGRLADNKRRKLARIRVANAATGIANSGTQMDVFNTIESRYDEEINEYTTRALGEVAQYTNQIAMSKHTSKEADKALSTNLLGQAVGGIMGVGVGMKKDYDRTGKDPFNIFT